MVEPDRHEKFTESVDGRHGPIRFFTNDTVIGAALRLYGEWAENELRFFHHFIPAGGTVLDVGAFIGTHALAFAQMVGPEGSVLSFEPQPQSFALLEENVRANRREQVRLHQAAVGAAPGEIALDPMNVGETVNFGGLAVHEDAASDAPATHVAPVVTLDSLRLERCDFIKLDVEGAEDAVLKGATGTIARLKPVIYAECNSLADAARSFEMLQSFGYAIHLHVVDAFNAGNFNHATQNIFGNAREAGLIAVPPERALGLAALTDPSWQLFELKTLDDLAYGLLQKPQYFDEVLRVGAAARAGGLAVQADEYRAVRNDLDALREILQREVASRQTLEAQRSAGETRLGEELQRELSARQAIERQKEEVETLLREQLAHEAGLRRAAEQRKARADAALGEQRFALAAALEDLAVEREAHRRDLDERQELLATVARLQSAQDELAGIRKSNLFKLVKPAVRAELRLRRNTRKYRDKAKRLLPGKWPSVQRIAKPGAGTLAPLEDHSAVVGATIALAPLRADAPAPVASDRPLLVCLSHVSPCPPRAGNEYRIQRLLGWVRSIGWDVLLLVCPLPGDLLSEAQIAALAQEYPNVVVVERRGMLRHQLARPDLAQIVSALDGVKIENFAETLHEEGALASSRLLPITRTFCPDVLLELLRAVDQGAHPSVVQVNYGFMTRGFPLLRPEALKIVDTHDVFSTKASKVVRFGITDSLALTPGEERQLLQPADVLIAIQPDEARELRALNGEATILTVGVDMPAPPAGGVAARPVALMVASANEMNRKGLRDFLRFAWPLVLKEVPEAEFHVVGSVGECLSGHEPNVRWLGRVDDLDAAYAAARLVVNPAVAGTGLKIKTLEALAQLRPIVLWPSGVDGVSPDLKAYCQCVSDWFDFARCVIRDLTDPEAGSRLVEARGRIAELLSQDHVYAEFGTLLKSRQ